MNRLLTEGRQAFLRRVSGIERGAECARYEPLLSALADGEASPGQLAVLRPHMRTCLSCRARLREFRAMPERVASVVPAAVLVASDVGGPPRSLAESAFAAAQQKIESAIGAAQTKAAAMGDRVHAAAELATGQKVAAVAASAAAFAGGGTAIDEFANHQGPPLPEPVEQVEAQLVKDEAPVEPAPPPANEAPPTEPAPEPAPAPPPQPAPPPPDPATEFAPGGAQEPDQAPPPQPQAADTFSPASTGGSGGGSSGASGEFAP